MHQIEIARAKNRQYCQTWRDKNRKAYRAYIRKWRKRQRVLTNGKAHQSAA